MKQNEEANMEKQNGSSTNQQPSIRRMRFAQCPVCELYRVALVPSVQIALDKWRCSPTFLRSKSIGDRGMLVGDLAMSFYAKPRFTHRVEVYYPKGSEIPGGVIGFTRHHKGVFQENTSKIEVRTYTPETLHIPESVTEIIKYSGFDLRARLQLADILNFPKALPAKSAYDVHDGLKVASLECMIVLKLYASDNRRLEYQALGDIARMLENNPQISTDSFEGWGLSEFHLAKLSAIIGMTPSASDFIYEENEDRIAEVATQFPTTQTRFELSQEQNIRLNDWLVGVIQQAAEEQVVAERGWRPRMVEKIQGMATFRELSDKEEWWLSQLKKPYPRPLPYYGENGEGLTYAFTPTKHGTYCRVTEEITESFIDLDDLGWG